MPFRLLLFDLDDTIYPPTSGLWGAISERIALYMTERLSLPPDQVHALRRGYFEKYGSTLRGLQEHHQVDAVEFLQFVHDLPLAQYLTPDPALRPMLLSLPQRRWICTNADSGHARRVLDFLGLSDCFEEIVDICAANFIPKPAPEFYLTALGLAGETEPQACVFLDDLPRNLAPARALGLGTVLVNPNIKADPAAMVAIPGLPALPQAFPELWEMQ